MATLLANGSWLHIYTFDGTLVDDFSTIDIPEMPFINPGTPPTNYGTTRQLEWIPPNGGGHVLLAWRGTTPEGQLEVFAPASATRHQKISDLMDLEDVAWNPAGAPLFRWLILPKNLKPNR